MITKEELNEIKEKRKTKLYYEEKEYLQYIFLNAISNHPNNFVFKGGTCLRICYGTERASEDLDFSTNLSISELKKYINHLTKNFELLNIKYEIYSIKEFKGNIRFEIRFEGPLFSGPKQSTNTLKIDFNKQKIKNKKTKVVQKLFSDIPIFSIIVLDEKEIFAEKIRSLINRTASKDFYDLWMLLNKNIEIDKALIKEKLKEEKSDIHKLKLPSKEQYETELKNLVHFLPDYKQVKKEVLEFFEALNKWLNPTQHL